jgi:hypothetical protein
MAAQEGGQGGGQQPWASGGGHGGLLTARSARSGTWSSRGKQRRHLSHHGGGEPHRVAEQLPLAATSSIGFPDASHAKALQVKLVWQATTA